MTFQGRWFHWIHPEYVTAYSVNLIRMKYEFICVKCIRNQEEDI